MLCQVFDQQYALWNPYYRDFPKSDNGRVAPFDRVVSNKSWRCSSLSTSTRLRTLVIGLYLHPLCRGWALVDELPSFLSSSSLWTFQIVVWLGCWLTFFSDPVFQQFTQFVKQLTLYGLHRSREQPQALQPSRWYNRDEVYKALHLTVLERENPYFHRAPTISSLFTVPDARACD